MSIQLLDKVRRINRLLHNNQGNVFSFSDVAASLGEALTADVAVVSRKGKVLGLSVCEAREGSPWGDAEVGKFIDNTLNERLLNVLSTQENMHLGLLGLDEKWQDSHVAMVAPIFICGERLGTFLFCRAGERFSVEDIILAEFGVAVVGLEMLRSLSEEHAAELRARQSVKAAVETLSSSEVEAVKCIFDELDGDEGILVASKVADRVGITRSVIVNALRKLESAGVIESRSSGMRGTYLRIVNDMVRGDIEAAYSRNLAQEESGEEVF